MALFHQIRFDGVLAAMSLFYQNEEIKEIKNILSSGFAKVFKLHLKTLYLLSFSTVHGARHFDGVQIWKFD